MNEINTFVIGKKTLYGLLDEWLEDDSTTIKVEIYPIEVDMFLVWVYE